MPTQTQTPYEYMSRRVYKEYAHSVHFQLHNLGVSSARRKAVSSAMHRHYKYAKRTRLVA